MRRWSPEEERLLMSMLDSGIDIKTIALELCRSEAACKARRRTIQKRKVVDVDVRYPQDAPVAVPYRVALEEWKERQKYEDDIPTLDEILDLAQQASDIQQRIRPIYTKGSRRVETTGPVFIVHAADFHLGAPTTNYIAFLKTTKLLLSDPRFLLIIVGRDLELAWNRFISAAAVSNQVLPPWVQIEASKQWMDSVLSRTLCICADNHGDERLQRILGDIGLIWDSRIPYFQGYGVFTLTLVDKATGHEEEYLSVLTHKYKGHSVYHKLQPTLRLMRDIHPLADWYCTAHKHVPSYLEATLYPEARPEDSPKQHFLVTGTFNDGPDLYSIQNFGGSGFLGLPVLKLWPDKHQIVYYESPERALEESVPIENAA